MTAMQIRVQTLSEMHVFLSSMKPDLYISVLKKKPNQKVNLTQTLKKEKIIWEFEFNSVLYNRLPQ